MMGGPKGFVLPTNIIVILASVSTTCDVYNNKLVSELIPTYKLYVAVSNWVVAVLVFCCCCCHVGCKGPKSDYKWQSNF